MVVAAKTQAQERDEKRDWVVITERVDDVALLIGHMNNMGLVEILDQHLPRHWKQRGLSWGWTSVIWLAYILSEGDHRKVSMERYIQGMKQTLQRLSGQAIECLDFSDDRLAHLLTHLSKPAYWHKIEQALTERSVEVYQLAQQVIRCDATTVSGYHEVVEQGLFQFGHSKDDPTRAQIKLMTGALDPLGMPLVTEVVSGERADDGLYRPLIDRIDVGLNTPELLFVGDCKMSALETRAHVVEREHYYLSPLPLTGQTAQAMDAWIDEGVAKAEQGCLEIVTRSNAQGEVVEIAHGYECAREVVSEASPVRLEWQERVLIIHSPRHAQQQQAGLDQRLARAQDQLRALTPARGKGKRQLTDESRLVAAIDEILTASRLVGLLSVDYERQVERRRRYIGRGRGSAKRPQWVEEKVRYQITAVVRNEAKIADLQKRFGWRAFATNSPKQQLSLAQAVLCYRKEYRVERIFQRLKSHLLIAPLFVKRDDQIQGLTHLLTLGVRVLTLMEFVVGRSLQQDNVKLPDLHTESRQKVTDKPTSERMLKSFSGLSLTIIKDRAGHEIIRQLNHSLSFVQREIVQRLGLAASLYEQLEIRDTLIL